MPIAKRISSCFAYPVRTIYGLQLSPLPGKVRDAERKLEAEGVSFREVMRRRTACCVSPSRHLSKPRTDGLSYLSSLGETISYVGHYVALGQPAL